MKRDAYEGAYKGFPSLHLGILTIIWIISSSFLWLSAANGLQKRLPPSSFCYWFNEVLLVDVYGDVLVA